MKHRPVVTRGTGELRFKNRHMNGSHISRAKGIDRTYLWSSGLMKYDKFFSEKSYAGAINCEGFIVR